MSHDLEQRRLAIVRALRDTQSGTTERDTQSGMTERDTQSGATERDTQSGPVQRVATERLQDVERGVAEVRLQVAHALSRIEDLEAGQRAEPTDAAPDRSSVAPGMDFGSLMSPVASRALFGHA